MPDPQAPYCAVIEDLDPEPAGRARGPGRRERLLGLTLALGLLIWASAQWVAGAAQLDAYHTGAQAAALADWQRAAAAFSAAGAFRDAEIRAAAARRTVAERATQIAAAERAAQSGDWPRARAAVDRLRETGPDLEAGAAIARQADAVVYREALSGAVVLRVAAPTPGLYAYRDGGWTRLPDSDAMSRVRGVCPDGAALFDIPGAGGPARRLALAQPGASTGILAIDPRSASRFLCFSQAIWGESFARPAAPASGAGAGAGAPAGFTYLPRGAGATAALVLPDAAWSLRDVLPDGAHILLAQSYTRPDNGPGVRLYRANAAGGDRALLIDAPGSEATTDVSPDGRHALFTRAASRNGGGVVRAITLLDLSSAAPPRLLAAAAVSAGQRDPLAVPTARFLRAGARAGRIVLVEGVQPVLRLIDPDDPLAPVQRVALPDPLLSLSFIQEESGDTLLWGRQAPAAGAAVPEATIGILDAAGRSRLVALRLDPGATLTGAWLRQGALIFAQRVVDAGARQSRMSLRALPLAAPADARATGMEIYSSVARLSGPAFRGPAPLWRLGDGLLAYVSAAGDLHARTYDGAVDLLLEPRVRAIFSVSGAATAGGAP